MANGQNYGDAGIGAMFDFSFNRFITLSVMKVLYGLGLVLIVLTWLAAVVSGFTQGFFAGVLSLVIVTLAAIVYTIFFRISLELIVVVFRIGENTSKLVQNQSPVGAVPPAVE